MAFQLDKYHEHRQHHHKHWYDIECEVFCVLGSNACGGAKNGERVVSIDANFEKKGLNQVFCPVNSRLIAGPFVYQ